MTRQARRAAQPDRFAEHGARLHSYASRIRQAIRSGHRLNFSAEQVLEAVQQAARDCGRALREAEAPSTSARQDWDGMAAVQDRIDDALMALRERMMFGPL